MQCTNNLVDTVLKAQDIKQLSALGMSSNSTLMEGIFPWTPAEMLVTQPRNNEIVLALGGRFPVEQKTDVNTVSELPPCGHDK